MAYTRLMTHSSNLIRGLYELVVMIEYELLAGVFELAYGLVQLIG